MDVGTRVWLSRNWSVHPRLANTNFLWHDFVEVCCGTKDALKFATQTSQNDKCWTGRRLKQRRVWEAPNGRCSEAARERKWDAWTSMARCLAPLAGFRNHVLLSREIDALSWAACRLEVQVRTGFCRTGELEG